MAPWWGSEAIPIGQVRHWRIGPLSLWVERQRREWIVHRETAEDPLDSHLTAAERSSAPAARPGLETNHYAAGAEEQIRLLPKLADRPVIVRPRSPFQVPSGLRAQLFVSSPLWIDLDAADHGLDEFAIYRASDTWFGDDTISGSAAYAVQTSCRTDLEGLPIRPHRAVTPIVIENRAADSLRFERLAVPVPSLALYADGRGRLWTQTLELTRSDDDARLAEARVLAGPPEEAGDAHRVSEPRESPQTGMVRVFDAIF